MSAYLQILNTGFVSKPELGVYLDAMQKEGTWGDGIVLSAAARLYDQPIVIVMSNGHFQSIDTAVSSPEAEPMRLGMVSNHYVSILKNNNCHFNNVYRDVSDLSQSLIPCSPVCDIQESKLDEGVADDGSSEHVEYDNFLAKVGQY